MIEALKSLTAIVHVRFNYKEKEASAGRGIQGEVELMAKVLDHASELAPEMQKIMVKFANYLGDLTGGAEPT